MSTISIARLSRPLRCIQPLCGPARSSFTHWITFRTYASGQGTPSSLLSSALDQKQRTSHSSREDSVGPFQLGISQAALKRGEKAKRWSELSVGGKVLRTTQRTTNLTVILLGAGLSAVLVYALTSELFSKNSPTVLYNDACERIKTSPRVSPPPSTENRSLINRVVGRQVPSCSPCFPQQPTLFCASASPTPTCSITNSS